MPDNKRKDNYKGKGKRNNRKDYRSHDQKERPAKEEETTSRDGFNSPEWYAASPQLLTDAASVSFSEPVGSEMMYEPSGNQTWYDTSYQSALPGVCEISWVPAVGVSTGSSSAINLATRNIYSFVRHANAGHANYNSPDLMMYLLSMDSIYSYYAWMVRLYGALRAYNIKSRYMPKAVISAMGADFDALNAELADFRYYINTFSVKAGSLCGPATMSYNARHIWLNSHVYLDDLSAKAQLYLYNQAVYWKFDATADPNGGRCVATRRPGYPGLANLTAIITFGNALLEPILADEDMGIMSGDILKAFGPENLVKLATIPEDYFVIPEYNEEVLSQIQNATVLGTAKTLADYDVSQKDNVISYNPRWALGKVDFKRQIFTLYKDAPTPSDVMVATRLTNIRVYNITLASDILNECGSELAEEMHIWYIAGGGTLQSALIMHQCMVDLSTPATASSALQTIAQLEKFNYHPPIIAYYQTGSPIKNYFCGNFIDVNNYTMLSSYELGKMHSTAILSEFAVPTMGSVAMKGSSTVKV